MSQTYSAVDASADPHGAADWQAQMATWGAVRAYKDRTYALLADGDSVLDVGCGPGVDLAGLGLERAVGVDPSATMCSRARAAGAAVFQGWAEALPFRDAAFGAARSDRMLQHATDPAAAIGEMFRVVRRGGRVVAAEPDQESLVIALPGVPDDLTDRVKALRRDIGYRNGRLASRLPEMLSATGLVDITVEGFPAGPHRSRRRVRAGEMAALVALGQRRPMVGHRACRLGPRHCHRPRSRHGLCRHIPRRRRTATLNPAITRRCVSAERRFSVPADVGVRP